MAAAGGGSAGEGETDGEGGSGGERKKDAGVLAATGASGAFIGWNLAHSMGLGLDLVGALGGELLLLARGFACACAAHVLKNWCPPRPRRSQFRRNVHMHATA